MRLLFATTLLLVCVAAQAEPRLRPGTWATPVIGTDLGNFYRIDEGVYRSEQPESESAESLQVLGIGEILNLRQFHSDDDELEDAGFRLNSVAMNAGEVTEAQIIEALRIIKDKEAPVLIHCWHGSDRTGVTVAAYRIVFNGWTKAQALDEMVNGGYGYHSTIYPNLVALVKALDVKRIREALEMAVPPPEHLRP